MDESLGLKAMAHPPFLAVRIAGTASAAPGRVVTTAELAGRLTPRRDPADMEARTGIVTRHFVDAGDTAAGLAADALRRALAAAALAPEALARIIFVSSLGGDLLSPATANLVAAALGLAGTCDCFDVNNACMGFLTAFDVAARSIATGMGPVGIVVVELPSRFVTSADARPFLVFGDAVAAVVLDRARGDEGVLGSWLRNDGIAFGNVRVEHAGLTGKRETIRFTAPSERMLAEAVEAVRRSTAAVLAQAGLSLADVSWFLPHQPNGALFEAIVRAHGIEAERVVPLVRELGSVGSASIPLSYDRLLRAGRIRPGERVLMAGVGGGRSSGAILYRAGA